MEVETTKFAEFMGYSYGFDVGDERKEDSWICPKILAQNWVKGVVTYWSEKRLNETQNWGETFKYSTLVKFEISFRLSADMSIWRYEEEAGFNR